MASKSARNERIRYNNEKIRIVLVGKTGAGKSATANTIVGKQSFFSKFSFKSLTKQCAKASGEVDGQKIAVIDTPGLFDTSIEEKTTTKDIIQCISYASPGPHIFLVVIRLGRFTGEEMNTVQKIQKIFGEESHKYSMVLFTHGDLLQGEPIEDCLAESEELQELVAKCNGQYHVFNNDLKDRSQVTELLNKIRNITEKNGGSHYTTEMFQAAEKAIEEEKERILKEKEEEMRIEMEEQEKKIKEKYEKEMKKVKDDMKRQNELMAQREREMEEKMTEKKEMQKVKDEMERQTKLMEDFKQEMENERREKKKMQDEKNYMKMQNELMAQHQKQVEDNMRQMKEMQELKDQMERQTKLMAGREREIEQKMREIKEMQKLKDDTERQNKLRAQREEEEIKKKRREIVETQVRWARDEAEKSTGVSKIISNIGGFFKRLFS